MEQLWRRLLFGQNRSQQLLAVQRSSVVSSDGTPIVWTSFGSREGVVVSPGSLSDGSDWFDLAQRLADEFAVHVMARRGVGDSGNVLPYAIEREYEDIAAVLDATGSTRLVGHSFGAICALGAALVHDGLARLVAYEPPLSIDVAVVPPDALVEIEDAAERGDVARAVEVGLRRCVRLGDEQVESVKRSRVWPEIVGHGAKWPLELRALHEMQPGAARYAAISVRTLLPVGQATPAGHHHRVAAETLLAVMPDARLAEIAGSGHQGHVEAPDALARELRTFLG